MWVQTTVFFIIFIVPNQYSHDPTISPSVPPEWGKGDSPGPSPNAPQTQTKDVKNELNEMQSLIYFFLINYCQDIALFQSPC